LKTATWLLPQPPSTNALYRNVTPRERATAAAHGKTLRGRVPTAEYAAWKDLAGWELKLQHNRNSIGPLPWFDRFTIKVESREDCPVDVDNLIKAIPDLLKLMSVIPDDKRKYMRHVGSGVDDSVESGKVRVTLREVGDEPLTPEEREADAAGSFHEAIRACGEMHKSGERPAKGGYFGR
jgi:Holliday junction resolvase RusA-like endonuclease